MRELIQSSPFPAEPDAFDRGRWPCEWLRCPAKIPCVVAWRLRFHASAGETVRLHVSADERYELYLDGERIGQGPQRGDVTNWFYETYRLDLAAGEHTLVARTWALGELAPMAQLSLHPAFVLAADGQPPERFNTGRADWQVKVLDGYTHVPAPFAAACGYAGGSVRIDGRAYPWGVEAGQGEGWSKPDVLGPTGDILAGWGTIETPRLQPATLPAMLHDPVANGRVRHIDDATGGAENPSPVRAENDLADEHAAWQAMLDAQGSVTVPAGTQRRVLIDLEQYVCAYAGLTATGGDGSSVEVHWAEALYLQASTAVPHKGQRDEIEGKYFIGRGDSFCPDGGEGRAFQGLWWNSGRYLQITVSTADEPLTIDALSLRETRYPLERESTFACEPPKLAETFDIMFRSLQMCCHETYMDCPYYEQLMYAGDTRLQALVTYVTTRDDPPPRNALKLFEGSRGYIGLTEARYPSRIRQFIPAFSLYWIGMVHDYALWRDDAPFVAGLLPGVRSVVQTFLVSVGPDDLPRAIDGWDWVDWVPTWHEGKPDRGGEELCGIRSWLLVYALGLAADLERWHGEPARAQALETRRQQLAHAATNTFWDEQRGLMATDPGHAHFSEHAQCFAILSGLLDDARCERIGEALLAEENLDRATIYFSHYLFEVFRVLGKPAAIFDRMGLWWTLAEQGFRTCVEMPEPSRSDCHAWGAHPIYHAYATLLGIRPAGPGFGVVRVQPQLGPLQRAQGRLPHPRGWIEADLQHVDGALTGSVTLPAGTAGELHGAGDVLALSPGRNEINLSIQPS